MEKNQKKKRYSSPELVKYGDFKKLTGGNKAGNSERSGKASKTKAGGG